MDSLNQYVFISGTGRSGTNITKKLLSLHRETYALPFEYRFTIDPDGIISAYKILTEVWSPFQAQKAILRLQHLLKVQGRRKSLQDVLSYLIMLLDKEGKKITPYPYVKWELEKWFPNYQEHVTALIKDLTELAYHGYWPGEDPWRIRNRIHTNLYTDDESVSKIFNRFLTGLYDNILAKHRATCFIEDNTWSLLFAETLNKILPTMKFIHVVRDPRDVVVSMLHQRWCPNTLTECVVFYISLIQKIQHSVNRLPPATVFEVRLEDLIYQTDATVSALLKFLSLQGNLALKPQLLDDRSVNRWKRELDREEQSWICQELEPILVQYHYIK